MKFAKVKNKNGQICLFTTSAILSIHIQIKMNTTENILRTVPLIAIMRKINAQKLLLMENAVKIMEKIVIVIITALNMAILVKLKTAVVKIVTWYVLVKLLKN